MKHLVNITVGVVLVLMAEFSYAENTTVPQIEMYFGTVPSGQDTHHLATLPPPSPPPSTADRSGSTGAVAAAGPAPALSYLQVAYVGSSNCGWESIASSQITTVCDHGGVQLRVVTDELGYGNAPVATFSGAVLPASANYSTQSICWNGSSYTTACTPGRLSTVFENTGI